jgi:hypothetical protein
MTGTTANSSMFKGGSVSGSRYMSQSRKTTDYSAANATAASSNNRQVKHAHNFHKVMNEIHFATQLKRENLTEDRDSIAYKCYDLQRQAQIEQEQMAFGNRQSVGELSSSLTQARQARYIRARQQAAANQIAY